MQISRAFVFGLAVVVALAGCGASQTDSTRGLGEVTSYDCGSILLTTQPIDRDLLVTIDDRIYRLSPSVAGAGSRFSGGSPSAPVVFQSDGPTAEFGIGFRRLPTCTQRLAEETEAEAEPEAETESLAAEAASAAALAGPARLIGPEWRVEEIAGVPLLDRTRATLEFHEDGSLGGFASCNSYRSSFELAENAPPGTLSLGEIVTTRKGCPGPLMQQERNFLRILDGAARYRIDPDGKLAIETADGQTLVAQSR